MKELGGTLGTLAWFFALMSLFAIGGANSAVPEIHRFAVDVQHWMTDPQFSDIFGLAQLTPGPNVIVVTLIGYHVAGLKQVKQPMKLRAVGLGSARHFAEHLLAFGLRQFLHLRVKALAVRRDPCVSINHALLMAVTYAKEKPFQINAPKTLH